MDWMIPGTVRSIPKSDAARIEDIFNSMFLTGDLALRQVSELTGLEPYAIQNWVKRGFLTPPQKKRYNMNQLCRILNINMLKSVMPLETVCSLMSYINGHLDDTSDDIIRDKDLYFIFVRMATDVTKVNRPENMDPWLTEALVHYQEPVPGAKERVKKVLHIMLTAWAAAQLREYSQKMVNELNQ